MGFTSLPFIYAFLMSTIDVGMETLSKYYVLGASKNIVFLVIACLLYSLQPILFSKSLNIEGNGIGIMNVIWNVMSTCFILGVGILLFGEQINGYKWVGICLSIVALILLSMK
jgi:multidrug transporter EmrE-like cation transporter